jgi:Flp pilus assembly pilin Flp
MITKLIMQTIANRNFLSAGEIEEDWCMKQTFRSFWSDDSGQDLIEYTLLMAFVALASAALFLGAGGSISGIWNTSNSQLAAANTSAS